MTQNKLIQISKNAIKELESSEYEHDAILNYLNINEKEYQQIKNDEINITFYVVQLDYSNDNCNFIDTYLFDTYDKALKKFKSIIEKQKKNIDWVKDAFKEILKYEFETNITDSNMGDEIYWNIVNKNDWYEHIFLNLLIKQLNEDEKMSNY